MSPTNQVRASRWLDAVERLGNRLPDPATLFALGTLLLMLLSALVAALGWQVERVSAEGVQRVGAVSLLSSDGLWWLLSHLVENFVTFPPLGLVLVGLLGIGVAERSGLLPVLLRRLLNAAPASLLTPATVLVGILSSLALDAGYVVLPPLAAGLFLAAGRSPLAGIAAVTAGVTCGFSANLFLTGLDPLLAGLSSAGAQLLDADYQVAITANWWFMIASTVVLTAVGTLVTHRLVEPRLRPACGHGSADLGECSPEQLARPASQRGSAAPSEPAHIGARPASADHTASDIHAPGATALASAPAEHPRANASQAGAAGTQDETAAAPARSKGPDPAGAAACDSTDPADPDHAGSADRDGAGSADRGRAGPADGDSARAAEERGLRWAASGLLLLIAALLAAVLIPGAPLAGDGEHFPRWMEAMVPLLLLVFLSTGLAYGVGAGTIRSDRDAIAMMSETMRAMGPYIVLAFFAAQFIACFAQSRLGEMLAITGGSWLASLGLPLSPLVLSFVVLVMLGNLVMGSASAKYAFFAPVFVPMLMQAGVSPELTQAAYRVGDSVTNGITPFNPYLVIILAFVRRYVPQAGLGTLLALMLPYTLVFAPVWILMLGLWVLAGWPLGPGGALTVAVLN